MPIKLIPPRAGKTPYFAGRGIHFGRYVDRSTKAREKRVALQVIRKWEREIERGEFSTPGEATFATAVVAYLKTGGDPRPTGPLIEHFIKPDGKSTPLREINQTAIDTCALALFPDHTPATRNREVYTPISAILKGAGPDFDFKIRRPKGSRGKVVTAWLWPEQAFRIFDAAKGIDAEFGVLLDYLCYTGCRISEALRLTCNELRISEAFAFHRTTKNGDPRAVFLPPVLVASLASHPRGLERGTQRVFRFHQGGSLRYMLQAACMIACGLPQPKRVRKGKTPPKPAYELDFVNFHTFCHTYGTWMRRYAGLDTKGLVGTGRWKSEQSASRYAHVVPSEDAVKAAVLPIASGSKASA
jgi:integrase